MIQTPSPSLRMHQQKIFMNIQIIKIERLIILNILIIVMNAIKILNMNVKNVFQLILEIIDNAYMKELQVV